ncbi:hypothetical protein APICC_09318 [Apis cerana cerana]|uniref:Uncharacterized protein n=2 Tax=Apis cerana TaxID=7461 RepID=A0A2A3EGZ4_APICC|nr:hypothetical protein APICC_09318 [Apis cerana cerana]
MSNCKFMLGAEWIKFLMELLQLIDVYLCPDGRRRKQNWKNKRGRIMESWLSDVQRVRIPRPKFGSGNSVRRSNSTVQHVRPEVLSRQTQDVAKATEELRQALQDKL